MKYSELVILIIFLLGVAANLYYVHFEIKNNKESKFSAQSGALPDPTIAGNSVELSLNSRVSYHERYNGRASDQWLSNVLWAAGRAPITGDHRNIYE